VIEEIADGRTDLVFEYLAAGNPATPELLGHCAYYGDVSALKHLLANGARLDWLGENLDLNAAAYHGHWSLCRYLLDRGADPNLPLADTGEVPLHAAASKSHPRYILVARVLLDFEADPNRATIPGVETGSFMRDCRTKGETPLHRAAAFCDEEMIDLLTGAGADIMARDAQGDTPLSWASWYGRPGGILRRLCYGGHRVNEAYDSPSGGMEGFLRGTPHLRRK